MKYFNFIIVTLLMMFLMSNNLTLNAQVNVRNKPDTICIPKSEFKYLVDNVQRLFDNNGLLMEENDLLLQRVKVTDSLYTNSLNKYNLLDSLYYINKEFSNTCISNVNMLNEEYTRLNINYGICHKEFQKLNKKNNKNKFIYLGIGVIAGLTTAIILK